MSTFDAILEFVASILFSWELVRAAAVAIVTTGLGQLCASVLRRSAPIDLGALTCMSRPHGGVCLGVAFALMVSGSAMMWWGWRSPDLTGTIFCYVTASMFLVPAIFLGQATDDRYSVVWDDTSVEGPERLLTLWPNRHRIPVDKICHVTRASPHHWVAVTRDGRQISWSTLHCGARFLMLTLLVHSQQDLDPSG
ncbi:hypothetical protein [Jannaschia pohangensis]|uniref:Uncharacterized protein n=1 Tax=Jannaschia pohangensis TaxID=390807 RepID=A0A1I3IZW4_9RHOB|nr:hypothetical protein [Jannaschia pohangensis]SFI53547.1 hypothetical protein SAMN04488095_1160 [Jannaschia pohangensis]